MNVTGSQPSQETRPEGMPKSGYIQEGLVREIDKKKKKITGQTEWKDILGQGMNK